MDLSIKILMMCFFNNKLLLDVIVQVDKAKIGIEYDIEIYNTKELYTIFV